MGQKVNPIGFRLGIIRGWESNWFTEDKNSSNLLEDHKLRQYLQTRLRSAGLSRIIIERTPKTSADHTAYQSTWCHHWEGR